MFRCHQSPLKVIVLSLVVVSDSYSDSLSSPAAVMVVYGVENVLISVSREMDSSVSVAYYMVIVIV